MSKTVTVWLSLCSVLGACNWPIDLGGLVDDIPPPAPPCAGDACDGDEASCLFGEVFHDLRDNDAFELAPDEWIVDESALADEVERAQLVLAVQQSSHSDVSSVAEALARVDQNEVRRIWFNHRATGRAYVVYEYGAGDNSYGAYFMAGELDVLASIHDGDLLECVEARGSAREQNTETRD